MTHRTLPVSSGFTSPSMSPRSAGQPPSIAYQESSPTVRAYEVNDGGTEVDLDEAMDDIVTLIGERNFDLYDGTDGVITKT